MTLMSTNNFFTRDNKNNDRNWDYLIYLDLLRTKNFNTFILFIKLLPPTV